MIQISIETRRATITETEIITSGSVGIQLAFSFNEEWDGLVKTAVFHVGDSQEYYSLILEDDSCQLPWELLTEENEGEPVFVGVYGVGTGTTVVIPTIWAALGVIQPGAINGSTSAPPTPTQWAQILTIASDAANKAASAEEAAAHAPVITDGYWYIWDEEDQEYQTTGVKAKGDTGNSGVAVQDTEPDDPNVMIWVDPGTQTSINLGQCAQYDLLPVSRGGTGVTNISQLRSQLALGPLAMATMVTEIYGGTGRSNLSVFKNDLGLSGIHASTSNILSAGGSVTLTPANSSFLTLFIFSHGFSQSGQWSTTDATPSIYIVSHYSNTSPHAVTKVAWNDQDKISFEFNMITSKWKITNSSDGARLYAVIDVFGKSGMASGGTIQ